MIAVWFAVLNLAEGALYAAWHYHHKVGAVLVVVTVTALRWLVACIPSETLHTFCAPHEGSHTRAKVAARLAQEGVPA